MCDYHGCDAPVRASDKDFKPPTLRLCDKHGEEIDALIDSEDAAGMVRFWARSKSPKQKEDIARGAAEGVQRLFDIIKPNGDGTYRLDIE
jgi:hypothetical protein